MRKQQQEINKTGGGKNKIFISPFDERIVALTGCIDTVLGISGDDFGWENTTPTQLPDEINSSNDADATEETAKNAPKLKRFRPNTQTKVLSELKLQRISQESMIQKLTELKEIQSKRLEIERRRLEIEERRLQIEEKRLSMKIDMQTETVFM